MRTIASISGSLQEFVRDNTVLIVSMNSGGTDQASAPEVPPITTSRLDVLVTYAGGGSASYVRLPSGAQIGDEVKLMSDVLTGATQAFPPTGESFRGATGSIPFGSAVFTKITSTMWDFPH